MWLTELRLRCRSHRAQCLIHCGAYPLGAITSLAVEQATKASLEVVVHWWRLSARPNMSLAVEQAWFGRGERI